MADALGGLPRRRALTLGLTAAAGAALAACSSVSTQGTGTAATPRAAGTATGTATARSSRSAAESSGAPSGSPSHAPSPTPTWQPGDPATAIKRGPADRPQVALTFHGTGPVSITRDVMDILTAHGAHATVFAIGRWLAAKPEVARIILDAGNELGNHTWSHPALSTYGPQAMYTEIVRCRDEIEKLTGTPGAFFRQSQGRIATKQERIQAGRAGYARILNYDVDSTDWKGTPPATIRKAVSAATPGSIISLHLGRRNTVAALPGVLDDLAARGLTGVTGTELLR